MLKSIIVFLFLLNQSLSPLFSDNSRNQVITETLQQSELLVKKAMESGDTNEARELYKQAGNLYLKLSSQHSFNNGKLFYNAGNCFMQSGDIGKAIFCYKSALLFSPFHNDLRNNLVYARSLTKDDIDGTASAWAGRRFLTRWSLLDIRIIAALLIVLWIPLILFLFIVYKRKKARKPFYKQPMIWIFGALYLFTVLMEILTLGPIKKEGVIISEECIARKGDSTSYAPSFQTPLHQGTEFLTLEKRSGWLYIQLSDGRECWIEEQNGWLIELNS